MCGSMHNVYTMRCSLFYILYTHRRAWGNKRFMKCIIMINTCRWMNKWVKDKFFVRFIAWKISCRRERSSCNLHIRKGNICPFLIGNLWMKLFAKLSFVWMNFEFLWKWYERPICEILLHEINQLCLLQIVIVVVKIYGIHNKITIKEIFSQKLFRNISNKNLNFFKEVWWL
jgi:hypothetical protein